MPHYEAWFDGACEPRNPGGHIGYGAVVKLNSKTVFKKSGYMEAGPSTSNNVAEYIAVISVLEFLQTIGDPGFVVIHGDSKLVTHQLAGKWKARNGGLYVPVYRRAILLLKNLQQLREIYFQWIPREQNEECDALSKQALIERGIQPTLRHHGA